MLAPDSDPWATQRVPTCVWRATPALVVRLDEVFGEPLDTYVNGSQVWLRPDGPDELTIEWRLHPVAGYSRPARTATTDVFERTALAFATDQVPPAPLGALWDGLEAFPAYGDPLGVADLAAAVEAALGLPPDARGEVDHERIAELWERSGGGISVVEQLLDQLGGASGPL